MLPRLKSSPNVASVPDANFDRYRGMFETASDGIILFQACSGSILDVNARLAEMLGYSTVEAQAFSILEFPPLRAVNAGPQLFFAFADGNDPVRYEARLASKSGTPVNCEICASAFGERERRTVQVNIREIPARNRAQGALRGKEARMRLIVAALRDYAILTLDKHRRITSWSPGAEPVLGFPEGELLGQRIDIIYTLEDRFAGQPERDVDAAAKTGCSTYDREYVRKDGRRFPATGMITRLAFNGKTSSGFAMVVRDFTESSRRRQILEQTRRVESTMLLAAGIAHRFNNLLTPILGNATQLAEEVCAEQARMQISDVICAANRGAELTSDILAYAGLGMGPIKPLDFAEAVSNAAREFQPSIAKTVEVRVNIAANLPRIDADRNQIERVIVNLVLNAAEAIEGSGTVQVRANERTLQAKDLVDLLQPHDLRPGRYLCLEVEDSGEGIPEPLCRRIFDPFFTTKFTGRGLGLAVVAGIARRHGGGVEVLRGRQAGAALRVVFPVAQSARS